MENEIAQTKRKRSLRLNKLVAVVCFFAAWVCFNVDQLTNAAQSNPVFTAAPAVSGPVGAPQSTVVANSMISTSSAIAMAAAPLIVFTLISYSLLSSGKRGWGWTTLTLAAGVILMFARLGISLFNEISSPNSIQDWDS